MYCVYCIYCMYCMYCICTVYRNVLPVGMYVFQKSAFAQMDPTSNFDARPTPYTKYSKNAATKQDWSNVCCVPSRRCIFCYVHLPVDLPTQYCYWSVIWIVIGACAASMSIILILKSTSKDLKALPPVPNKGIHNWE